MNQCVNCCYHERLKAGMETLVVSMYIWYYALRVAWGGNIQYGHSQHNNIVNIKSRQYNKTCPIITYIFCGRDQGLKYPKAINKRYYIYKKYNSRIKIHLEVILQSCLNLFKIGFVIATENRNAAIFFGININTKHHGYWYEQTLYLWNFQGWLAARLHLDNLLEQIIFKLYFWGYPWGRYGGLCQLYGFLVRAVAGRRRSGHHENGGGHLFCGGNHRGMLEWREDEIGCGWRGRSRNLSNWRRSLGASVITRTTERMKLASWISWNESTEVLTLSSVCKQNCCNC